jgi:hypothetical protein
VSSPIVVDFMAEESHFADHMLPLYSALPPEMRGCFLTRSDHHKPTPMERSPRAGNGDMICVPSWGGLAKSRYTGKPVIFCEHGAGFRFSGHSYCGSPERPNVALFLCQNEMVAEANRAAHPHTAVEVVGVPKMDRWYAFQKTVRSRPTVAFAFHWDCWVTPGTRSAWEHYKDAIPALKEVAAARGWNLVGHSHPRIAHHVRTACRVNGIPFLETLDEVFAEADMLIADATSAAYEFASLDRPVVNLNAPWYHAEPVRGTRFPYHMPGITCEHPRDLPRMAELAFQDPPELQELRRSSTDAVYPVRGNASELASLAIQKFVESCLWPCWRCSAISPRTRAGSSVLSATRSAGPRRDFRKPNDPVGSTTRT